MSAIRIIDDHLELANIGSNTHAQIDAHIVNPSAHHVRYADSEATAAVAAEDAYVKNIGDTINGLVYLNGYLTINQSEDWMAIVIHGYDDESSVTAEINIDPYGNMWFQNNTVGTYMKFTREVITNMGVNLQGNPVWNPESYDDATLSGTPKLMTFLLGTTRYYVKAYPTKT